MKTISPQSSSADQRQRLLKLYQRHHRSPPGSTAELAEWIDSDQGREALKEMGEAKADVTTAAKRQR